VYIAGAGGETGGMHLQPGIAPAIAGYCLLMLAIGGWAARRTRGAEDFFLGGRRLGPWLAALSQGATQSSAWTLVGVSGAAYAWGLPAVWIWLSVVTGYAVNWFLVAPRLRALSAGQGSVTLVQLLTHGEEGAAAVALRRSASVIIVTSFLFYVAAQFQAAGTAFSLALGLDFRLCVVLGSTLIVAYTLVGGFWAASVTDFVQGALMLLVSLLLPVAALSAAGGLDPLLAAIAADDPARADLFGGRGAAAALAFVLGTFGIGLAAPGQPHVVNHFMAARDDAAVRRGGFIALVWIGLVLAGMLVIGWSGRLLVPPPGAAEEVLFASAASWLPPLLAGLVTVAVMSAIMSTVDSQLITATSSVTVDWPNGPSRAGTPGLRVTRAALVVFSAAAACIAMFVPESIYSRVLFAWNALGAAFGPLVILVAVGRMPTAGMSLACVWTGFASTVLFYLLPDAEGDVVERLLPFVLASTVALAVGRMQRSRAPT
jgi:sodium/proline symporter